MILHVILQRSVSNKNGHQIRNIEPRIHDGLVPIFSKTTQILQIDHLQPFGFPVYVLDSKLQQMKKIDK